MGNVSIYCTTPFFRTNESVGSNTLKSHPHSSFVENSSEEQDTVPKYTNNFDS